MQTIAKEMNFSESTFIYPPERGGDWRRAHAHLHARPRSCRWPAIRRSAARSRSRSRGRSHAGRERFRLRARRRPDAGVARMGRRRPGVRLDDAAAADVRRRRSPTATRLPPRSASRLADLLPGLPVQSVSCGVPFLFVPLATRAAVDAVAIDRRALATLRPCARGSPTCRSSSSPPSAPATATRRSTAGCWRRDSALRKIRRPARPAVRSAPTSSTTAS